MKTSSLGAALCAVLVASTAYADTLKPGGGQYGHITRINRGVVELGLDNVLIVRSRSETTKPEGGGDETTNKGLEAIFAGGPTFRYFVIDNLSLAVNLNAELDLLKSEIDGNESDESFTHFGFLGTVMVDYYLRLGRGMFFKPGIGGGYFFLTGSKDVEVGDKTLKTSVSRSGGVGRVQLGLVFYTSTSFNLKAGVDILARFGKKATETDGTEDTNDVSLFEVDAAWNVGFGYVF